MSTVNATTMLRSRRMARYSRRTYREPVLERAFDYAAVSFRRMYTMASQPMTTGHMILGSLLVGSMLSALLIAALLGP